MADPKIEVAPDADPVQCQRRAQRFAVRAEMVREPDFVGERNVYVTYNGRQEYGMILAPHEARKVFDLLASEFGFTTEAEK